MTQSARKLSRFTLKEVDAFFKQAQCVLRYRGLVFLIAPQQKEHGRILVITSRKVGSAPVRNKIRRQLKSIFYETQCYNRGYDCVVVVRKESTLIPFTTLQELLLRAIPSTPSEPSRNNT